MLEEIQVKKIKVLSLIVVFLVTVATGLSCSASENQEQLKYAQSLDGESISYSVSGKGDIALVFVHGWSCDSRYWREQIPYFSKKYKVVTIDLAGHGHSGLERKVYSLKGFADDIAAVVEDIDVKQVILIGHSMGAGVIAKATELTPKPVIGLIVVDAMQNVESAMSEDEVAAIAEAQKNDFRGTTRNFVGEMIVEGTDPQLKEWIINDMAAAPSAVGISAFQEFVGTFEDGGMAIIFDEIKVPVRGINADLWPTDIEANRRHMVSYEVEIMEGTGHFIMLEKPEEFNKILDRFVSELIKNI
jgi:pimeloyl-ACP methyl ester carboxylesterase